jgi:hypothetical protein
MLGYHYQSQVLDMIAKHFGQRCGPSRQGKHPPIFILMSLLITKQIIDLSAFNQNSIMCQQRRDKQESHFHGE